MLQEMMKKVENGDIDSLNRSKEEIIKTKKKKGGLIASRWYLKVKTSRTITCQPTPDGELARTLNKALNKPENKERILVDEDGGRPAMACVVLWKQTRIVLYRVYYMRSPATHALNQ